MRKNKYVFAILCCGWFACMLCACGKREPQLLLAEEEEQASEGYLENSDGSDSSDGLSNEEMSDAKEDSMSDTDNGNADSTDDTDSSTKAGDCELYVYICGEVNHPGVYTLPEGSRVCDVLELAGGLTAEASTNYWNQAMLLTDGMMLFFPTEEEAANRLGDLDWKDAEWAGSAESSSENNRLDNGASVAAMDGKVDINTATEAQLMTVPGIGASKAKSIISFRNENGKFLAIEDIMKVSGIKEGLFQQIKEYIIVY